MLSRLQKKACIIYSSDSHNKKEKGKGESVWEEEWHERWWWRWGTGKVEERLSPLRLPVNLHHFYFLCTFLVASQNNSFSEAITWRCCTFQEAYSFRRSGERERTSCLIIRRTGSATTCLFSRSSRIETLLLSAYGPVRWKKGRESVLMLLMIMGNNKEYAPILLLQLKDLL